MDILLGIISFLALIAGFFFLSEATMGVGIIAIGGVIAVFARIAQAANHRNELHEKLEELAILMTPQYDRLTGGQLPPAKPKKPLTKKELRQMVEEQQKAKQ